MSAKLLQLCLTLCNPVDCSPPGSSVLGIPQARILEWVAMPFFRGPSPPRNQTQVSCIVDSLLSGLPGKPMGVQGEIISEGKISNILQKS